MQVEREIKMVSKHTGLKPWMVFAIVGVVVVLLLLGIAVCVWRFCRSVKIGEIGGEQIFVVIPRLRIVQVAEKRRNRCQ